MREDDLEHAMDLIAGCNAIQDTVERARHYGAISRDALAIFPDGTHKTALLEAIEFSISRMH